MKRSWMTVIIAVLVCFLLAMFTGVGAAEETTVVGVVTEEGILETTDGREMEVADTEMGAELLDLTGKKVEVMGEITEENDTIIIRVTGYTVVEE